MMHTAKHAFLANLSLSFGLMGEFMTHIPAEQQNCVSAKCFIVNQSGNKSQYASLMMNIKYIKDNYLQHAFENYDSVFHFLAYSKFYKSNLIFRLLSLKKAMESWSIYF